MAHYTNLLVGGIQTTVCRLVRQSLDILACLESMNILRIKPGFGCTCVILVQVCENWLVSSLLLVGNIESNTGATKANIEKCVNRQNSCKECCQRKQGTAKIERGWENVEQFWWK